MAKLTDLCDIQYGYAFDSALFTDDCSYPQLVRIRDVKRGYSETFYNGDYPEEYVLSAGDLLIGMDGEFNIARWKVDGALLNQRVCKITAKDNADEEFLRFALSKALKEIEERTSFATVKHLSAKELNKLEIAVPSYGEQKNKSEILRRLERIIKLRQNELNSLDNLIKARFVEMFGIPIDRAKANMKFTDCVDFNPKKSEIKDLQDVEVSFVPMECVGVDGSFTIRENGPVSSYYKGYTYFRDGDVLLAKITPCFENGKASIAEGCKNGIGFGTTEFHVARPKEGVSNSYWIKYMLKNDTVHDLATINMTGSAGQKRIQTPFFEKLTIFCPPIELQNQFAEFVKQVDKSKVVVQKALDEAKILFDSLMQEYFG